MNPETEEISFPKDAPPTPKSWAASLAELVDSRLTLIRLEAQAAAGKTVRILICIVVAALALLFTWALLVAGAIAAISLTKGWPWQYVTLGAAGAHLLVALLALLLAKASKPALFTHTKAEFNKDRAWLNTLKSNSKSNG